jgi:hypothetical protein
MLVVASAADHECDPISDRSIAFICVRELVLLQYCDGPRMPLNFFPKAVEHLRDHRGVRSGANESPTKSYLVERCGTLSASLLARSACTGARSARCFFLSR